MRYLPTINLWDRGIERALLSGQLKLQCGQWIQCGKGPKSRYIGNSSNHITATHGKGQNQFLYLTQMNKAKTREQRLEIFAKFHSGLIKA